MENPTITLGGKKYEMRELKGRDWRILGEFSETLPNYTDADFMEKQAAFIAEFFSVTAENILDEMPLEDILPASIDIRNYIVSRLSAKIAVIEKNSGADKEP